MKTTFDAEERFYEILNVASVTDEIDGAIYRNNQPVISEKSDIVINSLPIGADFVQEGFVNINIYAKDLSDGTPDIMKLDAVVKAVISRLVEFANTSGYFDYTIAGQNLFRDEKGCSYVNLRVNYFVG